MSEHHHHLPIGIDGANNRVFYAVHGAPLLPLAAGVVLNLLVLAYLKPWTGFYQKPISERLTLYLAICHVAMGVNFIMEHVFMLVRLDFPPHAVCAGIGVVSFQFGSGHIIIVCISAVNAFVMVVRERRIPFGKYDWRLLLVVVGVPLLPVTVLLARGQFGPSTSWCLLDVTREGGVATLNFAAALLTFLSLLDAFCFLAIYLKIRNISASTTTTSAAIVTTRVTTSPRNKYRRSIQNMLLVMAAHLCQWWAFDLYGFWSIFQTPHELVFFCGSLFTGLGGVLNVAVYAVIKRRQRAVRPDGKEPNTRTN